MIIHMPPGGHKHIKFNEFEGTWDLKSISIGGHKIGLIRRVYAVHGGEVFKIVFYIVPHEGQMLDTMSIFISSNSMEKACDYLIKYWDACSPNPTSKPILFRSVLIAE